MLLHINIYMLVLIYEAWSICKDGGGYVRAKILV